MLREPYSSDDLLDADEIQYLLFHLTNPYGPFAAFLEFLTDEKDIPSFEDFPNQRDTSQELSSDDLV
jgi:hypothetical protein